MPVAQSTYTFSFAGYLLSVAAGCVVFALAVVVALGYGGLSIALFALFGVMLGLLPAMLLFLPVALLGIWLGNRFGLRSRGYAVVFGAVGAAAYYPLGIGIGAAVGSTEGASPWPAGMLAAAGAVAGYVYFVTERIDREARKRPRQQAAPPPVHGP